MKKNKIEHYSDKEALDFHNTNKSGKIEIISSKPMTSKRDLAKSLFDCLLYTSPSPRDRTRSRMPSSA